MWLAVCRLRAGGAGQEPAFPERGAGAAVRQRPSPVLTACRETGPLTSPLAGGGQLLRSPARAPSCRKFVPAPPRGARRAPPDASRAGRCRASVAQGCRKKKVQAGRSDVGRQTRAVARRAGLGRGWERAETPEGAQGVQTAPPRNRSCAVRAMQARPPDHSRRRGQRGAPRTRPASPTGSCSMPCPVQCGAPQTAERAMPRHRAPARGKPCPGPQFGARAPRLGDESTTARLCFNCCVWENLALAPSQRTAAAQ